MKNTVALTLRIPNPLNEQLTQTAKLLGMTKTALLRDAIHTFLVDDNADILQTPCPYQEDKNVRISFNINEFTYKLLTHFSTKHSVTINDLMILLGGLILEHYSKVISIVYSED